MYIFYIFLFINVVVTFVLVLRQQTNLILSGIFWFFYTVISLVVTYIFCAAFYAAASYDTHVLTQNLAEARFIPQWTEEYQAKTSGRHDTYETRRRVHPDSYEARTTGGLSAQIDIVTYTKLRDYFNDEESLPGIRSTSASDSHMIAGTDNDRVVKNNTGKLIPVMVSQSWSNPVRISPGNFGFSINNNDLVDPALFPYPQVGGDPFKSHRLLGLAAKSVSIGALDAMNEQISKTGRFGGSGLDVILIGYHGQKELGQEQEKLWLGGKDNDVVVTYGYTNIEADLNQPPDWAYCFGWCQDPEAKKRLADLVHEHAVNNDLLVKIQKELAEHWQPKNWSQVSVTYYPPYWAYLLYLFFVILFDYLCWFAKWVRTSANYGANYQTNSWISGRYS